ncbi:MAG: hypothetical protein Kow00123_24050 [Anaerolineales bacterium]
MPNMYLFYVDESGQREYGRTTRYFALCGLGVPIESWHMLNLSMLNLKRAYFGKPAVEIKSSWLRYPDARQKWYLDPYQISEDKLREFVERVYDELLNHRSLSLFGVVVDKVQMQRTYAAPQNPSPLAYHLIFERFQRFLETRGEQSYGIVIFDKIDDTSFRTGYENLLTRQHLRYLEQGTDFVKIENIVEGLLFIPSAVNNFLQMADLCAYNIYRQFADHGDVWDKPKGPTWPLYDYFRRIAHLLYKSSTGILSGYGIKKYPDHRKLGVPQVVWELCGDDDSGWTVQQRKPSEIECWWEES